MTKRCLIKECFEEPFVCFGLVLTITGILSNFISIVDDFEGYLFVKFFFFVYLFGTFFFYAMIMTDPLSQIKCKIPRKIRLRYAIPILFVLLLSVLPPLFEPYMFFSEKLHAIKDSKVVLEMVAYVYFVGLIGSPIFGIFVKRVIRKQLSKDGIEMPKVNYATVIPISWMIFIILLSTFAFLDISHICLPQGFCP